jgi:hypothetical protein
MIARGRAGRLLSFNDIRARMQGMGSPHFGTGNISNARQEALAAPGLLGSVAAEE